MRRHAAYFDSETNNNRVICIDDDGYYFNVVTGCASIEIAKQLADALDKD